jgi:hypothetical protein
MEVQSLLAYIYKIVGLKLLLITLLSVALYSTTSAYIEGVLLSTLNPLIEPPSPDGLSVISLYSGTAVSPITGLVSFDASRLRELPVIVWFEVTTPILANGTPVVLRGVDGTWLHVYKPRVVAGDPFNPNATLRVWVGYRLAGLLNVRPGDVLVIKPLFTNAEAIVIVAGVLDVVEPYSYEIIASRALGSMLRGSTLPSTVRVAFDPDVVGYDVVVGALGLEGAPATIARVASALVYGGYVRLEDPGRLQEYYIRRLGVPSEVTVVLALLSNVVVSLLNLTPAWLIYTMRGRSLSTLIELGVSRTTIRVCLALLTIPVVVAASLLGVMVAKLVEPPLVLGYPLGVELEGPMLLAHVAVQVTVYTLGLLTGGLDEG